MKSEIKEIWVNALESGDYEQGTGWLTSVLGGKKQFCCLGVLCDLAAKAEIVSAQDSNLGFISYEGKESYLPKKVCEWANLPSSPFVYIDGVEITLSVLNDGFYSPGTGWTRKTFQEIANLIKEQL